MQDRPILVFGATGQQGGSVATALLRDNRSVRAFVRPSGDVPPFLAEAQIARGEFSDDESIRAAMAGAYGVFLALPASATDAQVTDPDEVRWGRAVVDAAVEAGVSHLVYSSSNGVGAAPTGIAHYDGKALIEEHVRGAPIRATIVRPAGFMETLLMPGSGLETGRFSFFVRRDQPVQLVAVEDIGKVVAAVFANPTRFDGVTMEIASDTVTVADLERELSKAAGRPIAYSRYAPEFLRAHPLLEQMSRLLDAGPLAGAADFELLRSLVPDLTGFRRWLNGSGRDALAQAVGFR